MHDNITTAPKIKLGIFIKDHFAAVLSQSTFVLFKSKANLITFACISRKSLMKHIGQEIWGRAENKFLADWQRLYFVNHFSLQPTYCVPYEAG